MRKEGFPFDDSYLLAVLSSWGIERLNEVGRVSEEKCITGSTADHAEHSEPHVGQGLRWKPSVSYAEHVRHGFEKGPWVLLQPERVLEEEEEEEKKEREEMTAVENLSSRVATVSSLPEVRSLSSFLVFDRGILDSRMMTTEWILVIKGKAISREKSCEEEEEEEEEEG